MHSATNPQFSPPLSLIVIRRRPVPSPLPLFRKDIIKKKKKKKKKAGILIVMDSDSQVDFFNRFSLENR